MAKPQRAPTTRAAKTAEDAIAGRIHVIRGVRVMSDADLAALYGVSTKRMNQAVRRNRGRFPADFMFQLTLQEHDALRSQIAISNRENLRSQFVTSNGPERGGRRYRASVNILIMRAFVHVRRATGQLTELSDRINDLANQISGHDELFAQICAALRALSEPPPATSRRIGFRPPT